MSKFMTLGELMAEDDAKREAATRAEIAAEKAAWDALPQSEKDRIQAERDAKWDAMMEAAESDEDEDETDEEDEDEGDDQ